MSARRYTFDTNVLFYSVDPLAGEKSLQAQRIIALADPFRAVFLLQTMGELCFSVGRKRPDLLAKAHAVVTELENTFSIQGAQVSDLRDAVAAQRQHNLPFWDAMLWATARRTGCTLLLTEDFQNGRVLGGVTFRNPFTLSETELAALLG